MSSHVFIIFAVFSAFICCTKAQTGSDPNFDKCNGATGYLSHAKSCASNVRVLMFHYMRKELDEDFSGYDDALGESGDDSDWFDDYFYEAGDGWDFVDFETQFCVSAMDGFAECMHEFDQCDNDDLIKNLDGYISSYKNGFCKGGTMRTRLRNYKSIFTDENIDVTNMTLTCVDFEDLIDSFGDCEFDVDRFQTGNHSFEDIKSALESDFRDTFSCIFADFAVDVCSAHEQSLLEPLVFFFQYMLPLVPGMDVSFDDVIPWGDNVNKDGAGDVRVTLSLAFIMIVGATSLF